MNMITGDTRVKVIEVESQAAPIECSLRDFEAANAHADHIGNLRAILASGSAFQCGGGASPMFEVSVA